MDETRVLEKMLYYERSWRDDVTVDWLYKRSSGDSEAASNQPVGRSGLELRLRLVRLKR